MKENINIIFPVDILQMVMKPASFVWHPGSYTNLNATLVAGETAFISFTLRFLFCFLFSQYIENSFYRLFFYTYHSHSLFFSSIKFYKINFRVDNTTRSRFWAKWNITISYLFEICYCDSYSCHLLQKEGYSIPAEIQGKVRPRFVLDSGKGLVKNIYLAFLYKFDIEVFQQNEKLPQVGIELRTNHH